MKRIRKYFEEVRDLVSRRFPELRSVELNIGCPDIDYNRRHDDEGYRAYMHVHHVDGAICVHPRAEILPACNLRGLFWHEFGHLFGGPEQHQADIAVMHHFRIEICYDKNDLEYI